MSKLGLALSGGGYRASLFHLGAVRRLHELGIAQRLTRVSSVSGGSILAGHLAHCMLNEGNGESLDFGDRWEEKVAAPFRAFVTKDVRTWPTVKYLVWGQMKPTLRANHLCDNYEKRLTGKKLRDLPDSAEACQFIFLATDMSSGTSWRFEPRKMYSYERKVKNDVRDTSIATALTASACFPPLFGPMALDTEKEGTVYLTDGGVYDNSGMEPVWKNHDLVLVSDAGAPWDKNVPKRYVSKVMRYASIATNQVRAQRQRALIAMLSDSRKHGAPVEGALWRLSSDPQHFYEDGDASLRAEYDALLDNWYGYHGEDYRAVTSMIHNVRTDLDAFTDAESKILENHGYFFADLAVRTWLRSSYSIQTKFKVPHPDVLDAGAVQKALKHSHSRLAFWRRW